MWDWSPARSQFHGELRSVAHSILHLHSPFARYIWQPGEAALGISITHLEGTACRADDSHFGKGHGLSAGVLGRHESGRPLFHRKLHAMGGRRRGRGHGQPQKHYQQGGGPRSRPGAGTGGLRGTSLDHLSTKVNEAACMSSSHSAWLAKGNLCLATTIQRPGCQSFT